MIRRCDICRIRSASLVPSLTKSSLSHFFFFVPVEKTASTRRTRSLKSKSAPLSSQTRPSLCATFARCVSHSHCVKSKYRNLGIPRARRMSSTYVQRWRRGGSAFHTGSVGRDDGFFFFFFRLWTQTLTRGMGGREQEKKLEKSLFLRTKAKRVIFFRFVVGKICKFV